MKRNNKQKHINTKPNATFILVPQLYKYIYMRDKKLLVEYQESGPELNGINLILIKITI